nr:CocE/NonD family hydrolase [Williamsia sterculiae]
MPTRPTLPLGDPTGGADGLRWRSTVDGEQTHPRVHLDRDIEITMSDGVRLRATLVRPADRTGTPVSTPYPAIVNVNPYNRALVDVIDQVLHAPVLGKALHTASARIDLSGTPLEGVTDFTKVLAGGVFDAFGINRSLVRSGYAQLIVDVRGTGASHGKWQILGDREQRDSVEIIEWAAAQIWCNGKVGMAGWSYSAINSLQAADKRPAALGAVFAVEGCEDIVRDIYITGGMPSMFIPLWLSVVNALKWVPHPATALRDAARGNLHRWLRDRLASPATEVGSLAWGFLTGRDDRIYDDQYFDERDPQVDRITAPTFLFGAWHDLFGRSATTVYNRLNLPPGHKQLIIADGYHLDAGAGFGGAGCPPRIDVLERAWFDRWLKSDDNGVDEYGPVTLQQQGGIWSSADSYPRPSATLHRLYLNERRSGTAEHSQFDGGLSHYRPSTVTTVAARPDIRGLRSRDMTQVTAGASMVLGRSYTHDARFQERGALSFTTAPVDVPTQLTGAINLRLYVSTSADEGIWAVTVNDVAPDGTSTVLTNGALSMSNRAIDPALSEYAEDGSLLMAHHFLSRVRKLPVPSDVPLALDVDLVPTDALIDIGHRLRVDVYAASFPRYMTTVPDLIKARGRHQQLVLDPDKPGHLTFRAIGTPGW